MLSSVLGAYSASCCRFSSDSSSGANHYFQISGLLLEVFDGIYTRLACTQDRCDPSVDTDARPLSISALPSSSIIYLLNATKPSGVVSSLSSSFFCPRSIASRVSFWNFARIAGVIVGGFFCGNPITRGGSSRNVVSAKYVVRTSVSGAFEKNAGAKHD